MTPRNSDSPVLEVSGDDDLNARADAARAVRNWAAAARHYQALLEVEPCNAAIWVQLGHMQKEAGLLEDAETAYLRAIQLDSGSKDTRLQLAHLYKRMWRHDAAAALFRDLLECDPEDDEAWRELDLLGHALNAVPDGLPHLRNASAEKDERIVFDVTDLVCHIGHHNQLSGIQRVQCMILHALIREGQTRQGKVAFTAFDLARNGFRMIAFEAFAALLDSVAATGTLGPESFDRERAQTGCLFPAGTLEDAIAGRSAVIVLLGTGWDVPDYANHVANLKRRYGTKFIMLFHDLVPIYLPETCNPSTAAACRAFLPQVLNQVDLALCTSQSTRADLTRYCHETGLPLPPVCVTRLGSRFDEFATMDEAPDKAGYKNDAPFVLMVGTIEPRKNHAYAFNLWHCLKDRGIDVPRLVCVGRPGWGSESLLHQLFADPFLAEKVQLLGNVDDRELQRLYDRCLFTLFPSRYEGWGLPVGESLSHGKLCVLPRIASLPEVAGNHGSYIPLDNIEAAADIVAELIRDEAVRKAAEARVRSQFKPISWKTVARTVADTCDQVIAMDDPAVLPEMEPGTEYPLHALSLAAIGLEGDALLASIEQIFTCPIGAGRSTPNGIAAALAMRGNRWWPPDARGSCIKGLTASLGFAIASGKISRYAGARLEMLVDIAEDALPCALGISVNGTRLAIAKVAEKAVLIECEIPAEVLTPTSPPGEEALNVTMELSVVANRPEEPSLAPPAKVASAQDDSVVPLANGSALRLRSFIVHID